MSIKNLKLSPPLEGDLGGGLYSSSAGDSYGNGKKATQFKLTLYI